MRPAHLATTGHVASLSAVLALIVVTPLNAQTSGQAALWATQGKDCAARQGEEKPWTIKSYSAECRARFALREFRTLDEKLRYLAPPDYLADETAGKKTDTPVRDVAKLLGLPMISGSDGPAGLVRGGTATAFPSPITIAASFDRAAASRYGDVIGQEFRAAGLGIMLGPAFDIARSWKAGRLPESFGEDPFLVGEMAASEVQAIQANHLIATMKHFAVYTQEAGRVGDAPAGAHSSGNNMVSEKAMREVYLPPFEAAVTRAGAAGVMCSFPRVNGVYACENAHLFDILKREWRFDGSVGPDFPSAQRSISRAIMAGLDSASFGPNAFNAALKAEKPLRQAVLDGEVPEARVDDIILRKLVPMFRLGLYDDPPVKQGETVSSPERRAAAADLLAAGTVLLKNDRGILPFGPSVRSMAIIGAQATDKAVVVEQGSPYVKPAHLEPALDAIRRRAGNNIKVSFAQGTLGLDPLSAPAAGLFRTPDGQAGFRADYYASPNLDFTGTPIGSATVERPFLDKQPDVSDRPANNQWSVRYTATLIPKLTGIHKFSLHASGTVRLYVDGKLQDHFDLADFSNAAFANVRLTAGKPVEVRIDYAPRAALGQERRPMFGMNMGLTLEFGYAAPDDLIAQAARAARAADVAVVFVADRIGEGMDRHSLALQNDQDALIEAVAKANPRTVVVLNTGAPIAMPWLSHVAGVLEMWKPGDALGSAAAQLLFGDREPGGRLPITFPADEGQGPATRPHQFPGTKDPATGALDTAYFDEGVFVGYRYWDQHDQAPLFPFGHGLSYGSAIMSGEGATLGADGSMTVRLKLENHGKRATTQVPQLYVGFPAAAGQPPRQLKGFAKVTLQPGESRDVEIDVPRTAFQSWDEDRSRWRILAGDYPLYLGRSSRDIMWQGKVIIAGD